MKKKKIFLSMIISLLLILSFCVGVSAEEKEKLSFGYKSNDIDINVVSNGQKSNLKMKLSEIPSKYSSIEQSWFPIYVRNRNQNPFGTCWAFATANAADISYAKETNNSNITPTSPGHFAYFFYNRVVDPLGLTAGDKNLAVFGGTWQNEGGYIDHAAQAMANRGGLASEEIAPYSIASSPGRYEDSLANKLKYTAEEATIINHSSYSGRESEYVNLIKDEVYKHGAVATSILWPAKNGGGVNVSELFTDSNIGDNYGGHAVTIIGWDDEYSKTNFIKDWYNGNKNPSNDGAWICLNSWGSTYGDKNIFYVSYDDLTMNKDYIISYDMEEPDVNELLYQYDGTATSDSREWSNGMRIANVYDGIDDAKLTKVGFTEFNEGKTNYTIHIYNGLTGKEDKGYPTSGTLVAEKNIATEHAGYHTFSLDEPVELESGKAYSIVIICNSSIAYGAEKSSSLFAQTSLTEGQSFYSPVRDAAPWVDATNLGLCWRIKGYVEAFGQSAFPFTAEQEQEFTYGDENTSISIVKSNGCGALTYSVESGEDVLDVGQRTGKLWIEKAGTAVVKITSQETQKYREYIREVKVVVKKASQEIDVDDTYQCGIKNGGKIVASLKKGDGDLKYELKTGNSVEVNQDTGELTTKAGGVSVVTVSVSETDRYEGTSKDVTVTVLDKPEKVAGLKVVPGKKQLTVSFNKVDDADKYQISVSTKKKGTKVVANITQSKKIIKRLKSKKIYYVKVRAINAYYTGSWCKVKKVKVK